MHTEEAALLREYLLHEFELNALADEKRRAVAGFTERQRTLKKKRRAILKRLQQIDVHTIPSE